MSGTHWMANLVHFLVQDGPLDKVNSHVPWLIDYYDISDANISENTRILTTHLTLQNLPIDHFAYGGKTILIYRNPKDSAVSMYYIMKKLKIFGDFNLSWDRFLSYWLDGKRKVLFECVYIIDRKMYRKRHITWY